MARGACVDVARFDPIAVPVVAWDGDEVAAVSLNYAKRMGDWGFIATLGVRAGLAPPRARARAPARELPPLRGAGETTAALGVDSENPTGATRLYERAGMRVLWRADVWRKELRPGA